MAKFKDAQGRTCSICFEPYDEYGHEAWPINKGRCCNKCQDLHVIPERLRLWRKEREKTGEIPADDHRPGDE